MPPPLGPLGSPRHVVARLYSRHSSRRLAILPLHVGFARVARRCRRRTKLRQTHRSGTVAGDGLSRGSLAITALRDVPVYGWLARRGFRNRNRPSIVFREGFLLPKNMVFQPARVGCLRIAAFGSPPLQRPTFSQNPHRNVLRSGPCQRWAARLQIVAMSRSFAAPGWTTLLRPWPLLKYP